MLQKSSSFENEFVLINQLSKKAVAAEYWFSEKLATSKKQLFWKTNYTKRYLYCKSSFVEKVAFLKNLMLYRGTCHEKVAHPPKKWLFWKSNCPKELFILKKQLLGEGFALKKQLIWKEILRKGSCSKKETTPEK